MNDITLKHLERITKANDAKPDCIRVFISQIMRGKDDELIKTERECLEGKAVEAVESFLDVPAEDVMIIDSFLEDFETPLNADRRVYMLGESIKLLSFADVLFAPLDYMNSPGVLMEHQIAEKYDKKILYYNDVLDR